jgi:hypothetical protein
LPSCSNGAWHRSDTPSLRRARARFFVVRNRAPFVKNSQPTRDKPIQHSLYVPELRRRALIDAIVVVTGVQRIAPPTIGVTRIRHRVNAFIVRIARAYAAQQTQTKPTTNIRVSTNTLHSKQSIYLSIYRVSLIQCNAYQQTDLPNVPAGRTKKTKISSQPAQTTKTCEYKQTNAPLGTQ